MSNRHSGIIDTIERLHWSGIAHCGPPDLPERASARAHVSQEHQSYLDDVLHERDRLETLLWPWERKFRGNESFLEEKRLDTGTDEDVPLAILDMGGRGPGGPPGEARPQNRGALHDVQFHMPRSLPMCAI